MSSKRSGAELVCDALEAARVDTVFGMPGTQNVDLFEALRRSRLQAVVASHELAASFMANGYARVSRRPGVLVTIPGPGFTYALTGLAEAFLDSVPLLHLVGAPAHRPGFKNALQAIDQAAMAGPVVKKALRVERREEIVAGVHAGLAAALADEPGPALLEITAEALAEVGPPVAVPPFAPIPPPPPEAAVVNELARVLSEARRVVLYVGQGASGAPEAVRALAERLAAPVVATTSGRGVISEEHALSLSFDFGRHGSSALNELLGRADLVFAIGCKFSHNGAHGFRLRLPPEKLLHLDRSADNLGANFPCRLAIRAEAETLLPALLAALDARPARAQGWAPGEAAEIQAAGRAILAAQVVEPRLQGVDPDGPAAFFAALGRALAEDACLVTDSGLHQMLARRHYRVRSPGGFIAPSDFQSMGFAIPAALGARRAAPQRQVVALVGDGGLLMSGLELCTAVREKIPLTVIVFNDGHLGIIRLQQLGTYGRAFKTEVRGPKLEGLAAAVGASYTRIEGGAERVLKAVVERPGLHLVEVVLGDRPALLEVRGRAFTSNVLRRFRALGGLGRRRKDN